MGTSGRPLLTVFLLVRDEEETLDRAVDSVSALGPETVVGVDADSRDETRKIAERRAHRVIDVEFERELHGDFSAARNLLDEHGTGSWGLTLDGHEYLEPDSAGAGFPPTLIAGIASNGVLAVSNRPIRLRVLTAAQVAALSPSEGQVVLEENGTATRVRLAVYLNSAWRYSAYAI